MQICAAALGAAALRQIDSRPADARASGARKHLYECRPVADTGKQLVTVCMSFVASICMHVAVL